MWAKIKAFVRDHIELVVWLPLIGAIVVGGWFVTWQMGLAVVEVGPILMDVALQMLGVVVALWLAWLAKRAYWSDLTDEQDKELMRAIHFDPDAAPVETKNAKWLLVFDRLQFVVMFLLVLLGVQVVQAAGPHPLGTAVAPREAACVRDLIVRWEVGSEARYVQRYQRPIWPGGASGVTWGLGYDGGHQPRAVIERDWAAHPAAPRLATTAGIIGEQARVILPRYRDIIVSWANAVRVFEDRSAPRFTRQARQAYGPRFDVAPMPVRCALVSVTYNRGPGMAGDRRSELRAIRDVCLAREPVDVECVAQQLEASCRVWANDVRNGVGLCNRRWDEAAVVRGLRT